MAKISDLIESMKGFPAVGLLLAALSGLFFTISNFMVQIAIELTKISTLEIVFARSFEQLLILIPVVLLYRSPLCVEKGDIISLITMSSVGFLNIVFIYLALDKIPISDALVITFTSPAFSAIFSYVIIKEKCNWLDCVCGLISFVGVVLVARPTFLFGHQAHQQVLFREGISRENREVIYLTGAGFALSGGVSIALYFVLTRKFARQSLQMITIFYPSLTGCVFSPVFMIFSGEQFVAPQNQKGMLSIFCVGFFSSIGLGCLTLSLKIENATNVALMRNLDLIYAYILQYCVMGIKPSWWSVAGGTIIVFATSVIGLRRQKIFEKCCYVQPIDDESENVSEMEKD